MNAKKSKGALAESNHMSAVIVQPEKVLLGKSIIHYTSTEFGLIFDCTEPAGQKIFHVLITVFSVCLEDNLMSGARNLRRICCGEAVYHFEPDFRLNALLDQRFACFSAFGNEIQNPSTISPLLVSEKSRQSLEQQYAPDQT